MNIFNPEHDLCLANGSPYFVPPDSALEFGRNCEGLTRWIEDATQEQIIPWGWNPYLKRQLQKQGVPDSSLPTNRELEDIRSLSHRRTAIEAREYIDIALGQNKSQLTAPVPTELATVGEIAEKVEEFGSVVLKAPWSGSGKGLRWVRRGEFYPSDEGWCRRTISRQGSVIVEKRFDVVQDFAMLFHVGEREVRFEGYSLFHCDNGMYSGNLLAGNEYIAGILCRFVPESLLAQIRNRIVSFLKDRFVGSYLGYLGVDMFIAEDENKCYSVNPCVEINVRMTMGLLARKVFDRNKDKLSDGTHSLSVIYRPKQKELNKYVNDCGATPLHKINEESRYAVIIQKN